MKSTSDTAVMIVATAVTAHGAFLSENQYQFLFSKYITNFSKAYDTKDVLGKYTTFKDNLDMILEHNRSNATYTMGINQFTDMTDEEFSDYANLNKILADAGDVADTEFIIQEQSLEPIGSFDWSAIIPLRVKSQGSCGSCWAFSASSTYSYNYAISSRQTSALDLSEQQLVDCDTKSSGCNGGLISHALNWVNSNKGLCTQVEYPYTSKRGKCWTDCNKVYKPFYVTSVRGTESTLVNTLKTGPIAVAVDASPSCFRHYSSGILSGCPGNGLNHAVVAVGFGSDGPSEFIKLRNSWGESWGDGGYVRIAYGKDVISIGKSLLNGEDVYPKFLN